MKMKRLARCLTLALLLLLLTAIPALAADAITLNADGYSVYYTNGAIEDGGPYALIAVPGELSEADARDFATDHKDQITFIEQVTASGTSVALYDFWPTGQDAETHTLLLSGEGFSEPVLIGYLSPTNTPGGTPGGGTPGGGSSGGGTSGGGKGAVTTPGETDIPDATEQGDGVSFNDVPASRWSAPFISYLAERGIVKGQGGGLFAPEANVNRAEFVTMLAGVAGADLSAYSGSSFSDVQSGDWFAPAVAWAFEQGVTTGTGQGLFQPYAYITREDMAAMIYRYCEKAGFVLPAIEPEIVFADAASFSPYAVAAIGAMQRAGIIDGMGDNTFGPKHFTTREAAAKMLAVTHQLIEKQIAE